MGRRILQILEVNGATSSARGHEDRAALRKSPKIVRDEKMSHRELRIQGGVRAGSDPACCSSFSVLHSNLIPQSLEAAVVENSLSSCSMEAAEHPVTGRIPRIEAQEEFFKLHGSEQESISTRDHAFCVWAKIWCLGWTISHRSGDGFCDPYPATDRRILNRVEQGRTSPTSLDKVRLRLIDFHPSMLITNTQPKRVWTWYVFFSLPRSVLFLSSFAQAIIVLTITRR